MEEKVFKCESCKIQKSVSNFHKKPNIRYHYHDCKECNIKSYIKELAIIKKIAQKQNKTREEVIKGLHADPTSNEYDDIMIDFNDLIYDVNNDNIKDEGLYCIVSYLIYLNH